MFHSCFLASCFSSLLDIRKDQRYTPEFKKLVVETMMKEKLSYSEAARQFEINDHKRVAAWERIYLEEGPEGFVIERRGRGSKSHPPKQLSKEVEGDLLAEVQRDFARRMNTEKTCKPWFWKTSDASTQNFSPLLSYMCPYTVRSYDHAVQNRCSYSRAYQTLRTAPFAVRAVSAAAAT